MTFGEKLYRLRKERGMSQEALAQELGVSRQAIYKWESDASLPEVEKLVALSRIFSVPVGWLLGGSLGWLARAVFIVVGLAAIALIPSLFMSGPRENREPNAP